MRVGTFLADMESWRSVVKPFDFQLCLGSLSMVRSLCTFLKSFSFTIAWTAAGKICGIKILLRSEYTLGMVHEQAVS